jgi:rifampicin phosphotransferase
MPTSIPLDQANATQLSIAGGKGANLATLLQAGFPVPPGFVIPTGAYRAFVSSNNLHTVIQPVLAATDLADPASLEIASATIRAAFSAGQIPSALRSEIINSYSTIANPQFVAVRSSATAEDLPGLSFAGQQDTYLNIAGETGLLQAVVNCWSSLWTGRAIGYRARNHISDNDLALAVIVQQMIPSQVSGVLFTANPLNGLRSEMVIDAAFGLGDALVSGQVEPDQYVVDGRNRRILSKNLGIKTPLPHPLPGGGIGPSRSDRRADQALADEQILALAATGQGIEHFFGEPQDIEWALADDRLYILQSRPITSLFPLPTELPVGPLKVLFSFGAVQGLFEPITPIGRYAAKLLFASGARLFGYDFTPETQTILFTAGERLWVNFTPILSNSLGRRIIPTTLSMVEPTIRQAVGQIWDDPRLQPGRPGVSFHARARLVRFGAPVAVNLLFNLAAPKYRRSKIVEHGERLLVMMETRAAAIQGDRWERLARRAVLLPDLAAGHFPRTLRLLVSGVAAGMASWNFLNLLSAGSAPLQAGEQRMDPHDLVLQVTRGMPYNPTTEMDLLLWEIATSIRHDPPSYVAFQSAVASDLSAAYLSGELPPVAQHAIASFLVRYGGRGLGEIDLGRTRWTEEPTHVFEMLISFLQIEDENMAPDVIFLRSAASARQAIDSLAHAVRQTRRGWLKARLVRFFAARARLLMGLREYPKFFAVRMMWIIHRELLKSGDEFVQAGELDRPDDLFYLSLPEINALAFHQEHDWRVLIAARRQAYQSEQQRRQIPRLLLSDGRAFYEGLAAQNQAADTITGSPVSPGSVQGKVRVVLDPRQAHLQPGEIMVCRGTDPSWTPLFLTAGGLVLETGGMMTHGAVVAREYGIPAIVGVDQATTRLHTGQSIQIDGSTGLIRILD